MTVESHKLKSLTATVLSKKPNFNPNWHPCFSASSIQRIKAISKCTDTKY